MCKFCEIGKDKGYNRMIHSKINLGKLGSLYYGLYLNDKNTIDIEVETDSDLLGKSKQLQILYCTMCGRCIDVCHQDALNYENRLKKLL